MNNKNSIKAKKKLSFIRAAILWTLLFALLILFASCAPKNDGDGSSENDKTDKTDKTGINADHNNGGITEIPEEAAEDETYKLPSADFNGYIMRLLTMKEDDWAISNLDAGGETGEPVNDAMYRRNRQVEETLNVVIQEIPSGYFPEDKFKKSILSNTDEYDLMFAHAYGAGPVASAGFYLNLHDIASLNLDQSYWDQGAIKSFELMNKLYFTTSDACVMTSDSIWVLYFNKKIVQNLGLEDPYRIAREGKWTMDAMNKMSREAAKDIDGDGVFTAADQWGLSSHGLAFLEFLECQGVQLVVKDSNGYPVLTEPGDKFVKAFSNVRSLMDKTNGMYLEAGALKGSQYDHATKTFMNDMSLFCAEVLGWARRFREMTADFGILPHPKFDENQPAYLNVTADSVPVIGIPITNPDPERVGVFIDALTALSATTVTPAYYTISLEGKFTRDEDSIEMLDIIRSNRIYDLAVIYNWGGFYGSIITYGNSKSGDNPVTVFDKNGDKVRAKIAETVAVFEEIK